MATASDCWERCGAVLDHDPHRPGAGPQRWLCPQCALWVPETRPWPLTCRDAGRC